jgi:hypothetical protein
MHWPRQKKPKEKHVDMLKSSCAAPTTTQKPMIAPLNHAVTDVVVMLPALVSSVKSLEVVMRNGSALEYAAMLSQQKALPMKLLSV